MMALEHTPQSNGSTLPMLEMGSETTDKRLSDLAQLYLSDLITREEFDLAKQEIFDNKYTDESIHDETIHLNKDAGGM
jgi:hypothetical protein